MATKNPNPNGAARAATTTPPNPTPKKKNRGFVLCTILWSLTVLLLMFMAITFLASVGITDTLLKYSKLIYGVGITWFMILVYFLNCTDVFKAMRDGRKAGNK